MKLTIEELDRQAKERTAKKEELTTKIADLEQRETAAKGNAETAAENGDVEAYKAASSEALEIGTQLVVARAQHKKLGSGDAIVTQEDAAAAWKDFAGDYNRKFGKLYADLEKKRSDLLSTYRALLDLQYDALEKRERLADYAGIKYNGVNIGNRPLDNHFPCRYLPESCKYERSHINGIAATDAEAVYYVACLAEEKQLAGLEFMQSKDVERVRDIVVQHRTKSF